MKYLNYLLFISILSISGTVLAQEDVGYIKYSITDIQSDNPKVQQQASMLKNGYMEQYVNSDNVLTVMNMAGMMVTKNLTDKETGNTTMYMDAMGRKIMVKMDKKQQEKMNSQSGDVDVSVEEIEDETKEILGYNTHKTLLNIKTSQGNTTLELWTTDELNMNADNYGKMLQLGTDKIEINGVPLQFTVDANGMMQMTYTAQDVKMEEDVDQSDFNVDTTGYKEMTFDEFSQSMGAMGGGM